LQAPVSQAGGVARSRRGFIRSGLGSGLGLAATLLTAACAPATTLAPGRPGRTEPAAPTAEARPAPSAGGPALAARPAGGTPTVPALAAARATPTPAGAGRPIGRPIPALGRDYLAYPEVAGTVQFSNCWDGARTPLVEAWTDELGAIYPRIKVENETADCAALREQHVTALAGGSPANVMMIKSDSVAFFAEQDALLPLDELLARDHVATAWFNLSELRSRTWEGRLYGLPGATSGAQHLLFANVGRFEKAGLDPARPILTWQDLDALVEPARQAGLLVMDPARVALGTTGHQLWTYANGGRYWDADLERIAWAEGPGLEAAEWLTRFVRAQDGAYERVASADEPRTGLTPEEWAAEKYLCCINGAGLPFQLQQQAPRIKAVAYEFPRNADNPASAGATPSTGGWMYSIPRAARDQDAAWEWIKLIAVSRSACAFAERQRRPSPLIDCNDSPALTTDNPFWPAIASSLSKSAAVPVSPVQPQLEHVYRRMQDEFLLGRQVPKAALEAAARDAQQILDDWRSRRRRP
jgi:multiple sugar transport system substrate-binding protein